MTENLGRARLKDVQTSNFSLRSMLFTKISIFGGNLEPSYENCGEWSPTPPPPVEPSGKKSWIVVTLILAVLVGLIFTLLTLLDPFEKKETSPVAARSSAMKTTTPVETSVAENSSQESTSANLPSPHDSSQSMATESAESAARELEDLRVSHSSSFSGHLLGHWAVQLASTQIGSDDASYLAKQSRLDSQYDTYLSTTDDFYNKRETGDTYWVTFLAQGFPDKDAAESWCESHNLDSNLCMAREMKPLT